ncbi:MAG: hypothetical protein HY934_08985, partial [Candidatus Firestonebacteria bacterium]|nr:hypothetical protein [Candidatus Firestonebacteria bacterium]
ADELALEFKKHLNVELLKSKKPEEILSHYKQVLEEKLIISIIEQPLAVKKTNISGYKGQIDFARGGQADGV